MENIETFMAIKVESGKYWSETDINPGVYGYQVQKGTKWKEGLTEEQIKDFEKEMGLTFPLPLINFYLTMNGLDKPGINVSGSNKGEPKYQPIYYSYPENLPQIKEMIAWIYEENHIEQETMLQAGISRIFPISGHRFMLVDEPTCPILSMYGTDIIYLSENIVNMLVNEIFDNVENISEFENPPTNAPKIKYWLKV
ncbi:SMI1/KNR4 family protein [Rufibacter roseolus]|uniref:SMI1/KNR4 family protein n=1 Tax=Rufibacter roseolus TaxID=2817375 RepID=UPI001B30D9D8|nr:SMI1/KNR4 family protein [Rufibacter roseolus]